MSYHLFVYGEYDNPGGMNDYAGKFETIEAIVDYLVSQREPSRYGDIVQITGDDFQAVGHTHWSVEYSRRRNVWQYWVTLKDSEEKLSLREIEELYYDVELPPGFYAYGSILLPLPAHPITVSGFS